jgi:hypothetical protein
LIGPDAFPCTRAAETGSLSDEVRCAEGHCSAPGGGCDVPPRRPRADGGGISPPPCYARCTVTEVTELSFPPPGAAAGWCPGVPDPTGAVYSRPRDSPFVPSLRRLSYPFRPLRRLQCGAPASSSRRGGIPPPPRYALSTATEVTELSFPPPGAAAVWCPGIRESTGAVYRSPRDKPFVPSLM